MTWKGCYDGINRIQREWNQHVERDILQHRLEHLATLAIEAAAEAPPPRWPFSGRVLRYLQEASPRCFAERVRAMIEALVTACQEEGASQANPLSSFSAEAPFRTALPFLELHPTLATDRSVALEPTNFALPAVKAEDPWPPSASTRTLGALAPRAHAFFAITSRGYLHACLQ